MRREWPKCEDAEIKFIEVESYPCVWEVACQTYEDKLFLSVLSMRKEGIPMSGAIKTSRYQIFNHWKNLCIDKHGGLHTEGTYPYEESIPVVEEWDSPQCWGCGKFINIYDADYEQWAEDGEYKPIWNSRYLDKLQKAHIVASSLGGSIRPENLFLLCAKCHRESPDTKSRRMFLSWVYKKRKSGVNEGRYLKEAIRILREDYGIVNPVFDSFGEIFAYGTSITAHACEIVDSSFVYALVENALKNRSGLEEEAEKMFENMLRSKITELTEKDPLDRNIDIYREVLGWYREAKAFEMTEEEEE